jgi:hypothetical protein
VSWQQLIAHAPEGDGIDLERLDLDAPVGIEGVGADASVCGDIWVLLADWFTEHVDLDLARCLGELGGGDGRAPRPRQALEQAHGVGAGGTHAGAGWHVGDGGDLEGAATPMAQQRLAQDRVADLADLLDLLQFAVLHAIAALEAGVGEHVCVLVDGAGHEEAAVLAIVGGQIGAAPAERDPQWRPTEDDAHSVKPAASASSWNMRTVSSENCSRLLPRPSSFFSRSWVMVMM